MHSHHGGTRKIIQKGGVVRTMDIFDDLFLESILKSEARWEGKQSPTRLCTSMTYTSILHQTVCEFNFTFEKEAILPPSWRTSEFATCFL